MRLSQTSQFKKDVKRQKKRGKDPGKLKAVVEMLAAGKPLPREYPDHPLLGRWVGCRDCPRTGLDIDLPAQGGRAPA